MGEQVSAEEGSGEEGREGGREGRTERESYFVEGRGFGYLEGVEEHEGVELHQEGDHHQGDHLQEALEGREHRPAVSNERGEETNI